MTRLASTAAAGALAFVILLTYGLVRPPVESLFVETYGSGYVPGAWAAVTVAVGVTVAVYNRLVARVDLVWVLSGSALLSGGLLVVLLAALTAGVPLASFALYVWKDVYIVVVLETFWAIANATHTVRSARWAYGFFLIMGSLGGLTGNLGLTPLTDALGTHGVLWASTVTFVALAILAAAVGPWLGRPTVGTRTGEKREVFGGLGVLRGSPYLVLILVLICMVQLTITLIDYQYVRGVELAFPEIDDRTKVMGQIESAINFGSLVLQLLTGPILRLVGVPLTLIAIPCILGLGVGAQLFMREFMFVAIAKVGSKTLDYSLFRAAKEILYIPLDARQKTLGKAIIDMFVYRTAKGGVSLLLLGLFLLERSLVLPVVEWVTLALLVPWGLVALALARRYRALEAR